jgi:large repetitive protein
VFASEGFNLIGAADRSTGFTSGVLADQVGTMAAPIDPVVGPLQVNGGPTATHALLRGSSAINKGFCFGVHQDQRGEYRPFDYPGVPDVVGGDGSDIGAFELHEGERFERRREGF